ncbi:MAG: hypothetical protein IAE79_14790 [Anaerolinea sp.]|nr:hypothetical protein [Anaerolinea sp.]
MQPKGYRRRTLINEISRAAGQRPFPHTFIASVSVVRRPFPIHHVHFSKQPAPSEVEVAVSIQHLFIPQNLQQPAAFPIHHFCYPKQPALSEVEVAVPTQHRFASAGYGR